jgi:hypothetical protein
LARFNSANSGLAFWGEPQVVVVFAGGDLFSQPPENMPFMDVRAEERDPSTSPAIKRRKRAATRRTRPRSTRRLSQVPVDLADAHLVVARFGWFPDHVLSLVLTTRQLFAQEKPTDARLSYLRGKNAQHQKRISQRIGNIRLRHADAVPVPPWPPSTGSAGDSAAGSLPMPETSVFMAYHYKEIWDREFQSFLNFLGPLRGDPGPGTTAVAKRVLRKL